MCTLEKYALRDEFYTDDGHIVIWKCEHCKLEIEQLKSNIAQYKREIELSEQHYEAFQNEMTWKNGEIKRLKQLLNEAKSEN